jgi:hypothetical protein
VNSEPLSSPNLFPFYKKNFPNPKFTPNTAKTKFLIKSLPKNMQNMQKKLPNSLDTTIGCSLPFNSQDFECSVTFDNNDPGSGIFSYYYEDRPPQYACLSGHRHNSCGTSFHCDETSESIDFGHPTPLYHIFCRDCCEKIKSHWKFDGVGVMITTEMTDEVRLNKEGAARVRRMEAQSKKKVKLERRAGKLGESKIKPTLAKK